MMRDDESWGSTLRSESVFRANIAIDFPLASTSLFTSAWKQQLSMTSCIIGIFQIHNVCFLLLKGPKKKKTPFLRKKDEHFKVCHQGIMTKGKS